MLFCITNRKLFFFIRFNNTAGQFPAVYLTSCKGRRLPENVKEASASSSDTLMRRLSYVNDYERV